MIGHLKHHELRQELADGLLARWRATYARATAHKRAKILRMVLRRLEIDGAPKLTVTLGPRPRPRTIFATPEEIQALLRKATPPMRLFLLLASSLGLRFGEAEALKQADWDQERHTITFRKKGGDTHTLPVSVEIERLFALAPEGATSETPFMHRLQGRERWTRQAIRYHWNRLKAAAGITRPLFPHALRHTAAITLYELTKDLLLVQQLLGHTNMSTTAWYIQHADTAKLRPLVEAMWTPKGTVQ